MLVFSRFPIFEYILESSATDLLDMRFVDECVRAGVAIDSADAEHIAFGLVADFASGLPGSPPARGPSPASLNR